MLRRLRVPECLEGSEAQGAQKAQSLRVLRRLRVSECLEGSESQSAWKAQSLRVLRVLRVFGLEAQGA